MNKVIIKITVEKRLDGLYRPNVESNEGIVSLPCCSSAKNALGDAIKEARQRLRDFSAVEAI